MFSSSGFLGLVLGLIASSTTAQSTVYHHYEDMVLLNARADASMVSAMVHPRLTVDTFNGSAWVTIVASHLTKTEMGGSPVPFAKPYGVQLRTYVTGTAADGSKIAGIWMFDLFLSDFFTAFGANSFFGGMIRCPSGRSSVDHSGSTWSVQAPSLPVTDYDKASLTAALTIGEKPVADTSFFLDRAGWFGATGADRDTLMFSELAQDSRAAPALSVGVDALSTSVWVPLGFTKELGPDMCNTQPYACFFVGAADETFNAPAKF